MFGRQRTVRLSIASIGLLALPAALCPSSGTGVGDAWRTRILSAHNAERGRFRLPGLTWDPALERSAARYAAQLANTGAFAHSNRASRRGAGENLWMGSHGAFSVEEMLGGWTAEKRVFAPGFFPNVSRSGYWSDVAHYTQMIWPQTTRVGCALAARRQADYLVCHYAPAGNLQGYRVPR
jgi:cysteine-rich secretory family protein